MSTYVDVNITTTHYTHNKAKENTRHGTKYISSYFFLKDDKLQVEKLATVDYRKASL